MAICINCSVAPSMAHLAEAKEVSPFFPSPLLPFLLLAAFASDGPGSSVYRLHYNFFAASLVLVLQPLALRAPQSKVWGLIVVPLH